MRVPGIAWWAGGAGPRGVVRQPASQLDLLPSLAALAGVATPPGIALDGQSLALTLTAGHTVSRENSNMYTALHLQPATKPVFLYRGSRLYAVRWAEYKAHYWTWTTPQVNIVLIVSLLWRTPASSVVSLLPSLSFSLCGLQLVLGFIELETAQTLEERRETFREYPSFYLLSVFAGSNSF